MYFMTFQSLMVFLQQTKPVAVSYRSEVLLIYLRVAYHEFSKDSASGICDILHWTRLGVNHLLRDCDSNIKHQILEDVGSKVSDHIVCEKLIKFIATAMIG